MGAAEMGGAEMLEMRDIEIRQGAFSLTANWSIEDGARVAVIGPSGAGKSTLLLAIAGFLPVRVGQISVAGVDISRLAPAKRPVAMLFQDNNLFPHMTVAQNVGLGVKPSLRLSDLEVSQVRHALDDVGLSGLQDRKPSELSGGQQSRAALARVLVQKKPLILLDEPFAALGPALKAEMLDLVADLCARTGSGLLMVSHDPEDARRICPQCCLVADGVAHAPQDTQKLLDHPPEALRAYLG